MPVDGEGGGGNAGSPATSSAASNGTGSGGGGGGSGKKSSSRAGVASSSSSSVVAASAMDHARAGGQSLAAPARIGSSGSGLTQSLSLGSLSSSLPRHAPLLSGGAGSSGSGGNSGPNSATPLREPMRIASVSPARARQSSAGVASGQSALQLQQAQQQQLAQLIAARPSPPSGAQLAPPTERTRLLLDGGPIRNDLVDAADLEDDEEAGLSQSGPLMGSSRYSSRGSSSVGSGCSSPPPEVLAAAQTAKNSRAFLTIMLPVTVGLCVANSVTWKRTLNRFASVDGSQRNLEFFVNQWTLLLYTLIAGAILAYRWLFTNLITPEMRAYPKSRFAVMGGLDAVAGLFAIVGGALTAGQVQIVVQQANIPITMGLSRLYLKVSSYAWSQYIGALVIVVGGLLSAFGSGAGGGVSAHVLWYGPVLILIGIIPGSMSNVYKEENFKTFNLDIYYLTTYVAVWQTGLSFLCVPLFTMSYFGGIPSATMQCGSTQDLHEMPGNIVDGWTCFLGYRLEGYICEDTWPSTCTLLLLYVAVNFAFNMALLSMVKHGSALYLVVAVAVALPITNLMFTQRWAMGADVEELSLYNLLGIVLVVAGFLLYSLVTEAPPLPREGEHFEYCREFVVPTGPLGHSMYVTEFLPGVMDADLGSGETRERRHSFDFHSSPSVRDAKAARKKKFSQAIRGKTSRTP